jgi:hypothetical protein
MVDYLTHPLDSCFKRVERAHEHLLNLMAQADDTFRKQANSVVFEFDPNPPYKRTINHSLPTETFYGMQFGILMGEICYNLRSALDYLVFELARLDSGAEQSGTQFPIIDAKEDFVRDAERRWLKGINASHVAAIERLQPYNGCNWTRLLRECSNPDKHRHFMPSGGHVNAWIYTSLENDLSRIPHGYARTAPHAVYGTVDVKVYVTGNITFPDGTPVIETFEEIEREVANTLAHFKPDF